MSTTPEGRLEILGSLYSHITHLKESGDPDALESAARFLDVLGGRVAEDSRGDPVCSGAAAVLRFEAEQARWRLDLLSKVGIGFDFDRGRALLPSRGRGPRRDVVADLIGAAFDAIDPREWYSQDTLAQVRDRIMEVLIIDDEELADLSDARIRRAIERHVDRR